MGATAAPSALQRTIITEQILKLREPYSFLMMSGMVGKTASSPVYRKDEPGKEKGNTFKIPLLAGPAEAAITDDSTVLGSEEGMVFSATTGTLHAYKKAVRTTGKYSDRSSFIKILEEAVPFLAMWRGMELDYQVFAALKLSGVYDTSHATHPLNGVVYGGNKTSFGALTADDKMTASVIRKVSVMSKVRGIQPLMIPGYGQVKGVLCITPSQEADLKSDEEWLEAQKHAANRGNDNPIFTGMTGMMDGVVVKCPTTLPNAYGATNSSYLYQLTTDPTFDKAEAIFMGGQAVGYGVAQESGLGDESIDYDWARGLMNYFIGGFIKTTINLGTVAAPVVRDFGTIYVPTAASKISIAA